MAMLNNQMGTYMDFHPIYKAEAPQSGARPVRGFMIQSMSITTHN